jgi:branched-chain amino acid transport system permease protein
MRRDLVILLVLFALFLALSPGAYYTNLGSKVLITAILALSVNLLIGEAGLMSLAQSAFGGVAAYCIAWFTVDKGSGHLAALVYALLISLVLSAIYGAIALRVLGIGFLMITLALGQITWGLAQRWVDITGGENGITGMTRPMPFGISIDDAGSFFVFTVIVFLAVYCLLYLFSNSCFGATVRSTRDQQRRMSALGYNVWLIRWFTFVLAGMLAAVAGVLDAYYNKFASPNFMSLMESAAALLMVIVGGSSVLLGPLCGAVVVLALTLVASSYTEHWVGLLGLLFLIVVLFMPDGVLPSVTRMLHAIYGRLFRPKAARTSTSIPARSA